jgi:hypothetical protein
VTVPRVGRCLPSDRANDPADLDFTSSSGFGGLASIPGCCLSRDLTRAYLWRSVAARAPRDHLSHHRNGDRDVPGVGPRLLALLTGVAGRGLSLESPPWRVSVRVEPVGLRPFARARVKRARASVPGAPSSDSCCSPDATTGPDVPTLVGPIPIGPSLRLSSRSGSTNADLCSVNRPSAHPRAPSRAVRPVADDLSPSTKPSLHGGALHARPVCSRSRLQVVSLATHPAPVERPLSASLLRCPVGMTRVI